MIRKDILNLTKSDTKKKIANRLRIPSLFMVKVIKKSKIENKSSSHFKNLVTELFIHACILLYQYNQIIASKYIDTLIVVYSITVEHDF
jgi:putative effector of murein hydrolase LrgA (UPF0299 family)